MSVQFARPDVSTLMLRLFPRPLHPELFDTSAATIVHAGETRLHVQICASGHTWMWQQQGKCISETITEKDHLLPQQSCILDQKVRGCRTRTIRLSPAIRYDVGVQLETLEPDLFLRMHDELRDDCERADLAHEFPSSTRFSPGALSLIRLELSQSAAIIHAYHTFPDHCAIVKTQSLIEWE